MTSPFFISGCRQNDATFSLSLRGRGCREGVRRPVALTRPAPPRQPFALEEAAMTRDYKYVSGDTHLEVPAWRWTNRVPEKHRDRAPRTVRLPNGADGFLIEGRPIMENAFDLYGGKGRDHWGPFGQNYATTPGTASAEDRLKCLDLDGMDAEIMFPAVVTGPRAWRNIRDDEPYLAVVRAYNDF